LFLFPWSHIRGNMDRKVVEREVRDLEGKALATTRDITDLLNEAFRDESGEQKLEKVWGAIDDLVHTLKDWERRDEVLNTVNSRVRKLQREVTDYGGFSDSVNVGELEDYLNQLQDESRDLTTKIRTHGVQVNDVDVIKLKRQLSKLEEEAAELEHRIRQRGGEIHSGRLSELRTAADAIVRCQVVLKNGTRTLGEIRYRGPVQGKRGQWVGVCLDKAYGKHTGLGYFKADWGHGIFLRPKSVKEIHENNLEDDYGRDEEDYDGGRRGDRNRYDSRSRSPVDRRKAERRRRETSPPRRSRSMRERSPELWRSNPRLADDDDFRPSSTRRRDDASPERRSRRRDPSPVEDRRRSRERSPELRKRRESPIMQRSRSSRDRSPVMRRRGREVDSPRRSRFRERDY